MKTIALALMLLLAGCTTRVRIVQPPTTATEQFLIAQSAIHATNKISRLPSNLGRVFVDTSHFTGTPFTVALVQAALLRDGVAITDTRAKADTILSISVGVQSVDNRVLQIGVPSVPIPSPIPGLPLATPSLAFATKNHSVGITMIHLVAWNAHTGRLISDLGEKIGVSYSNVWNTVSGAWVSDDFPKAFNPRRTPPARKTAPPHYDVRPGPFPAYSP